MGAYYMAVIERDGEEKMYDTHDVGNGLKLMEHSYIGNEYVERIMSMLKDKSGQLTWVCDYYEGTAPTWETANEQTKEQFLDESEYIKSDYIILNHTKELKIDIAALEKLSKEKETTDWWPIHPLPILCNSNEHSQGGGDFHKEDSRRAIWKGDTIQIVNKEDAPERYFDVTGDVLFYES